VLCLLVAGRPTFTCSVRLFASSHSFFLIFSCPALPFPLSLSSFLLTFLPSLDLLLISSPFSISFLFPPLSLSPSYFSISFLFPALPFTLSFFFPSYPPFPCLPIAHNRKMLKSLAFSVFAIQTAQAFYLPGIAPATYKTKDSVSLRVNALQGLDSALPYDYYNPRFHFCQPEGGPQPEGESLGSVLTGDRIFNSPFDVGFVYQFDQFLSSTFLKSRPLSV
jgi:hypothetical protein